MRRPNRLNLDLAQQVLLMRIDMCRDINISFLEEISFDTCCSFHISKISGQFYPMICGKLKGHKGLCEDVAGGVWWGKNIDNVIKK